MNALGDHESSPRVETTRRERRLAQSRARRTAALMGWLGYGVGVFVVVGAAAWLAVRGGVDTAPAPAATVTAVQPVISLPDFTTTTQGISPAPTVPVADAGIPTTTTTTTPPATDPALSVAATPTTSTTPTTPEPTP